MIKQVSWAIALMLTFSTAASASVIFNQAPDSPVTSLLESQFDNNTAAFGFRVFDGFELPGLFTTTHLVTDVHWRGAYFNVFAPDPNAVPTPNATGFGIDVHLANFVNDPSPLGPPLASHTFSMAQVNETFVATQLFAAPNGDFLKINIFDYDVILPTPFPGLGGVFYSMSIFAFQPGPSATEAQWAWVGGNGGQGVAHHYPPPGPPITQQQLASDRAFAITDDVAVPEPATLGVVALGLVALTGVAVRRRKNRA